MTWVVPERINFPTTFKSIEKIPTNLKKVGILQIEIDLPIIKCPKQPWCTLIEILGTIDLERQTTLIRVQTKWSYKDSGLDNWLSLIINEGKRWGSLRLTIDLYQTSRLRKSYNYCSGEFLIRNIHFHHKRIICDQLPVMVYFLVFFCQSSGDRRLNAAL